MTLPAVVLVGGQGTRLRPLTERTPKPMLPLLGRPLLAYTFDHLRSAGVDEVVLACCYLPTSIRAYFGTGDDALAIRYVVEPEPLGTAGAIAFAAGRLGRTFLALNGDSLREADLRALVAFHRERGARASILLTRVADPSRYGVVAADADGRVRRFVEKPSRAEEAGDLINAGVYVLEPDVLDLVRPGRATSIEREVFPALAAEGSLFALALPGYWLDVGTPQSYLQAHLDALSRLTGTDVHDTARVDPSARLVPPVVVAPGASLGRRACVGPYVHVGADAAVGEHTVLRFSAVLPQARVEPELRLARAIVAPEVGTLRPDRTAAAAA